MTRNQLAKSIEKSERLIAFVKDAADQLIFKKNLSMTADELNLAINYHPVVQKVKTVAKVVRMSVSKTLPKRPQVVYFFKDGRKIRRLTGTRTTPYLFIFQKACRLFKKPPVWLFTKHNNEIL